MESLNYHDWVNTSHLQLAQARSSRCRSTEVGNDFGQAEVTGQQMNSSSFIKLSSDWLKKLYKLDHGLVVAFKGDHCGVVAQKQLGSPLHIPYMLEDRFLNATSEASDYRVPLLSQVESSTS